MSRSIAGAQQTRKRGLTVRAALVQAPFGSVLSGEMRYLMVLMVFSTIFSTLSGSGA
jgi:hypothetical protein